MKKLLKGNISWKSVIVMAVVSAVITALLNCIPALFETSLTAPAETLEVWIVLAVFIIMNCKSYKEAMLKTFVFFLLSQPLIYLIEVPFKDAGWGLFGYYRDWAIITVLTIPGSAVAYRVKKGDVLSAVILSVANLLMIISGAGRIDMMMYEFPRYVISVAFCLVFPFIFIFALLKEKRSRAVATVLTALIIAASLCKIIFFPAVSSASYFIEEGNWSVVSVSDPGIEAKIDGDSHIVVNSRKNGSYVLILKSDDGREVSYDVTVEGGNHYIDIKESQNEE